jgi:putative tricarboxylic transport membrane protein
VNKEPDRTPPAMVFRRELLVIIVLLSFGVFLVIGAAGFPFGTPRLPGPAIFPIMVGGALVLMSSILLISCLRARGTKDDHASLNSLVVIGFVALVVFGATFEVLGAPIAVLLFSTVFLMAAARYPAWKALLAAALIAAGIYVMFSVVLGVPLPTGPIRSLLEP